MSKEINYPIKYAVLELKIKGGWLVGYEYITQGFIVSKCYVMESKIAYCFDGTNKITHKVVFPFEDISCLQVSIIHGKPSIGEKNIPSYDACSRPYPVNVVTDLYDSYEEAKCDAEAKNEKCRHDLLLDVNVCNPNWKEQFIKIEEEFNKKLELCYLFEKLALEKTKDMEISESLSINEQVTSIKILKPIKK